MAGLKQYEPTTRGKHKGEIRFRCSWRNSEGRQIGKTLYGRRNATRFNSDIEAGFVNRDTGEYFDVEREETHRTIVNGIAETRNFRTFRALADRFLHVKREEGHTTLSTLEDYQQLLDTHILTTLADHPLTDIGLPEIEDMVLAMQSNSRKPGPRTLNKCLILTRSIFSYGIDLRWCTENPAKRKRIVKYQKRDGKVLQPAELRRIINNTEKPFNVAMMILAFLGCRRGEAIALKWSDIDFEGRTLLIERSFKTRRFGIQPVKTKQRRRVPLPDEVLSTLRTLAADQGAVDPDDWLFPGPSAVYPIGGDVLLRRFKIAEKESSLSGFVIHDMRHSFITHMSEAGVDPASVQGITGHSNLSTLLNIYTHSRMAGKRRAMEKMTEAFESEDSTSAVHPKAATGLLNY